MIEFLLFCSGFFLIIPILGSLSVIVRMSLCIVCALCCYEVQAPLVFPSFPHALLLVFSGIIAGAPLLMMQLAWSNLAESIDLSRGVSIGSSLHPFTEWAESTASSVAGWLYCYYILVRTDGVERILSSFVQVQQLSEVPFAQMVNALWREVPTLLSIYQDFILSYGWIFALFIFIDCYLGGLSRSLQQLPLSDLSMLIKLLVLVFIVGQGHVL
jgi:hypothetical protein